MRTAIFRSRSIYTALALSLSLSTLLSTPLLAATPNDSFVIARNTDDALTLDPHAAFEVSTGDIVRNLYQRLFRVDPDDSSKLVGDIADSWRLSDDGLTLKVKIKSGLVFSSGNSITSEDVVYSLRRAIKLKKSPSFMLEGLGWNTNNVDSLVKVGATGSVEISTPRKLAPSYIQSLLSTSVSAVVDSKILKEHEKDNDFGAAWLTNHSAGSAAYTLVTWKPREAIVLEASNYYSGEAAHLKRVIIRHVGEPASQRLLLESGDVDAASNLTADQLRVLERNPKLTIDYSPSATIYYVGLNQANPDLAKPKVREAFRYLVDYDGIANKLLKGQLRINQGVIGNGLPASLLDQPYTYDPLKARALLAEVGYEDNLSVDFVVPTLSPYNEIGQALVQSFGAAGVKLNLKSGDIKQVLTTYRGRGADLIVFSFRPDFADPQASLDFFLSNPDNSDASTKKSVAWRLHWQDPSYATDLANALQETDGAKRLQEYVDLQKKVRESAPFVLSFQANDITGLSKTLHGYTKPSVTEFVRFDALTKGE